MHKYLLIGLIFASSPSFAQGFAQDDERSRTSREEMSISEQMNSNTIAIISGTPGGTYFRMASDLAFTLDSDNLRILPVLGKGAGQNAYDIRFLRGIDLGFIRTDTLDQMRQDRRIANIDQRLTYIARLFNDELHVIANKDIKELNQLAGKKVSFDVKGSGTDYTGRTMFEGLGVSVEVVNVDQATAINMLKNGEIAAMVSVAASPVQVVSGIEKDRFHFVPVAYAEPLQKNYFPAVLTDKQYPNLVEKDGVVETVAVGAILGAYNWPENSPRYKRIEKFVNAFFSKIEDFSKPPRHPKWQEVNLEATIEGWKRFPAAQRWLDNNRDKPKVTEKPSGAPNYNQAELEAFWTHQLRNMNVGPERRKRMIKEFLDMQARRQ